MIRDLTPAERDAATALEADTHINPRPPLAPHTCVRITDDWAITTGRPCDTCNHDDCTDREKD